MSGPKMRIFGKVVVTWLVAGTSVLGGFQSQTPTNDDWDWYARFKSQALDALMPMAPDGTLVAYRRSGGSNLDVSEQYFAIRYAHGGVFDRNKLGATIVFPVGHSIPRQLLDLHMQDRQATFESVIGRIAVRKVVVDSMTCAAVREQMDTLETLSIAVPPRDLISVDPIHHRFILGTTALELDATLMSPRAPLVRWAVQTNDALLACQRR